MLSRGRRASGARAAGAHAQDRPGSVPRAAGRTRRSALDPHQRHRARPVRPEAQHADPRVTRPRGELGGTLRRDCCAASTSEAFTLRGHGGSFLAPSPSVIEGSFDISEVDIHVCRGCAIAAPESLASYQCRCRRTRTVCVGPRERVGGTGGVVSRARTKPGDGDPIGERAVRSRPGSWRSRSPAPRGACCARPRGTGGRASSSATRPARLYVPSADRRGWSCEAA